MIDLSDSIQVQPPDVLPHSSGLDDQLKDYELFKSKLNKCVPNITAGNKNELEIECVKNFFSDWISSTNNNTDPEASVYFVDENNEQSLINRNDLKIFKNYLLYLLNVNNDLEKLAIILKILKRLIYKSESFEWINVYEELASAIQSEFYIKYDHKLELNN